MEIETRAGMRRANCGQADCDWLRPRPRLTWLDMGIYWRQPHQSAPHLINEPEHCMDQEFYTSRLHLLSADRNCNRYTEETFVFFVVLRRQDALPRDWKRCARLHFDFLWLLFIRTITCATFVYDFKSYDQKLEQMHSICTGREVEQKECYNILFPSLCRYNWGERRPAYLRILFLN